MGRALEINLRRRREKWRNVARRTERGGLERTWGEEVFENGEVRKYGESTTDEKWDVTTRTGESAKTPYFDGGKPDSWEEALRKSEKLLNIQLDDSSTDESDYE